MTMMSRNDFDQFWRQAGLSKGQNLGELDSLSYATFLELLLPQQELNNTQQLHEFIFSGPDDIWDNREALYSYLSGEGLRYKFWRPKIVHNVLKPHDLSEVQRYSELVLTKPSMLIRCNIFMRFALYDPPFLKSLHERINPFMERELGKKVSPTYAYLSLYGDKGYCPPHRDRNECQWTLDLCIKQDQSWPIFVEGEGYSLEENDGLIFSGTDQLHWRNRIHTNGHCHMLFFHFKEI